MTMCRTRRNLRLPTKVMFPVRGHAVSRLGAAVIFNCFADIFAGSGTSSDRPLGKAGGASNRSLTADLDRYDLTTMPVNQHDTQWAGGRHSLTRCTQHERSCMAV